MTITCLLSSWCASFHLENPVFHFSLTFSHFSLFGYRVHHRDVASCYTCEMFGIFAVYSFLYLRYKDCNDRNTRIQTSLRHVPDVLHAPIAICTHGAHFFPVWTKLCHLVLLRKEREIKRIDQSMLVALSHDILMCTVYFRGGMVV